MANVIENLVHGDEAVARLAHQFKEHPLIEGMLRSFVQPIQDLEKTLFDLLQDRGIMTAVGAQLDGLGSIVGESRRGRNDEEYRIGILARVAINTSQGTPENAIAVFGLITGASRVHYCRHYTALVDPAGPDSFAFAGGIDGLGFGDLLDISVGGVFVDIYFQDINAMDSSVTIFSDVNFEYTTENAGEDAFAFDGGIDGLGFGDVFDLTLGGIFAGLVFRDVNDLYLTMYKVLPGGVRLDFLGWFDDGIAFGFEGDLASLGFGDVLDVTVGGNFAKVVPHTIPFSFLNESERTLGMGDLEDRFVGGLFGTL